MQVGWRLPAGMLEQGRGNVREVNVFLFCWRSSPVVPWLMLLARLLFTDTQYVLSL